MKKVTRLTTALFLLTAGWNQATAQTITGQEKALKAEDITAGKVIAFIRNLRNKHSMDQLGKHKYKFPL